MIKASKIKKNLIYFKKNLKFKKNIQKIIDLKKSFLSKSYNIKIDYLELRRKSNLSKSSNTKKSNLFFAYHIKETRLIDNV